METKDFRYKEGITLISLIITIIVLLLLAGVSLSALVGENGIFNQTVNAKKEHNKSKEKEIIMLATSSIISEQLQKNNKTANITNTDLNQYFTENEIDAASKNIVCDEFDSLIEIKFNDTLDKFYVDNNGKLIKNELHNIIEGSLISIDDVVIGDYIVYEMEYIDDCIGINYDYSNAWRILNVGEFDSSTKMFSNLKIISTGIPARLKYSTNDYTQDWLATTEDTAKVYNDSSRIGNRASYALEYNFKDITFFNNIFTGADFILEKYANNINNVHNLTLKELNIARNYTENNNNYVTEDAANGLFYLKNLNNKYNVQYWLGTAFNGQTPWVVMADGELRGCASTINNNGIRPVIVFDNIRLIKNDSKITIQKQ